MGQTVANGGILLKNGKMALFDVMMTSYNKMTAFSDFENASNVFLDTFSVVYEMKLDKKVALDGSKCCEWQYFAKNR